ncbi:MFS general substrate transporter [Amniculicola lignicola CBS 123094]|uniref:MFS general substrate transporter n=1 Tax=Amniculicola lignicola CBS 123094 TaxID=1392246 RepID=A0A6A5WCM0_9PLEO|nr:MFS general substrate transporter [Amniculicola lignicola CBS 123094]
MAVLLFRYIRGKIQEKKSRTAEDGHLVPEIALQEQGSSQAVEQLHAQQESQNTSSTTPVRGSTGTALTPEQVEENTRLKAEASRIRSYRWKMIFGLLLPNFLAAVDLTIVAPAVPEISSHFNRLSGSFNWIVAAYTLTFTTFVPTSGQIADIYGRHSAIQFHIFFIMIGSVFCAAAVTWGMMLFGRALQGLGAAGIMNLTRIILSDNMSLADNAKNNTIFSLLAGISYAVGPVIGGYLTQVSWRYCFVLPICVAFIAHLIVWFIMRQDLVKGRAASAKRASSPRSGYIKGLLTFDWPGMVLFILGVGLVILAIMWGGTQYAWSSAAVIAPLVIGAIMSIAFFIHEYLLEPGRFSARMFPRQIAMIPATLFSKIETPLLMTINFATGVALVSAFYFISYYWQLAQGYSASKAGVQLLYYTPGLGVGAYTAMYLCNGWPRQTFYPLFGGSIIETIGLAMLAYSTSTRQTALVNAMLALAGVGTGLRFMPVVLHGAGMWPTRIPAMQSLLSFMIPFGETIGISLMGSVFTNKFNSYLKNIDPGSGKAPFAVNGPPNLNILNSLAAGPKLEVQEAAAKAVMWSFISILPFMGLSVLAAALLGNVWIGEAANKARNGKPGRPEVKGRAMHRSLLLAVITDNVKTWTQEVEEKKNGRTEEPEREDAEDLERRAESAISNARGREGRGQVWA